MSGLRSIAAARNHAIGLFLAAVVAAPQLGCGGSSSAGGNPQTVSAPSGLSYADSPVAYTKGFPILANAPQVSGGAVASYAISPALPAGLTLDASSGIVAGTPTVVSAQTAYTVTAANAGGSTTCSLLITVNDVPPTGLSYPNNHLTFTRGVAITPDVPTASGGAVTRFTTSPALPAGLAIDVTSGVISGTPTAIVAQASYLITAINSGGNTTFTLTLTVNDERPSNLGYSTNPAVYTSGVGITPNQPSSSGGAVVSYHVAPALPAGLVFNTTTGVISGAASAPSSAQTYTVTALNSGGGTTCSLTITVIAPPPTNLVYADSAPVYSRGVAITPDVPSNAGGAVDSYSVSPPLPAGLVLDPVSGFISGTPAVDSGTAAYTVTATNTGGSTTGTVTITVREPAPTALVYATNPTQYSVGTPIQPNVPTNGGGIITSYSVSPTLPAGLSLDPVSGVISGTPTTLTPQAHYTITGSNATGSTTCDFVTEVGASTIPPPATPSVSADSFVTTGQPGLQASTQDQGTANNTTYLWTVTNGNITSGQGTPAIMYTAGAVGPLTIGVKVSNFGGSATGGASVTVVAVPVAQLFTQAQVLAGTRARASVPAQANMTYSWTLSAGTVVSGTGNVLDYTAGLAAGAYQISVTVQSAAGPSVTTNSGTLQVVEDAFLPDPRDARQRYGNTVTVLADGRVLTAGGDNTQIVTGGTADLYDPWSNTWTTTGPMIAMRSFHAATLLADGRVLVTGGMDPGGQIFDSAEIYDPATNGWTDAGTMNATREQHTATLLPNGTVLVAGGFGLDSGTTTGTYLASAEIYDPAVQAFIPISSMSSARSQHTATLLQNGLVLMAAGVKESNIVVWLNTSELYDPTRQLFTSVGNLNHARVDHTASLLPSGKVLVAGGVDSSSTPLTGGEVFNPATGTWANTANSMTSGHAEHAAATLPSGKVLVMGGSSDATGGQVESYDPVTNRFTRVKNLLVGRNYVAGTVLPTGQALVVGGLATQSAPIASPELYDPASDTWSTTGSWSSDRFGHTATRLNDGTVLVPGGAGDVTSYMTSAERFDPATGVWSSASHLTTGRLDHAAALLADGRVLVVGGINGNNTLSSAEIYTPGTNAWTPTGSLAAARAYTTATLLPNGKVLVAGGSNQSPTLATAELYDPAAGTWSPAAPMSAARVGHTATLLQNGKVLVTGGGTSNTFVSSAEIYDPATDSWSPAAPMFVTRKYHTATLLPGGTVLVLGGQQDSITTGATAELYDPVANTWAPRASMNGQRFSHAATLLPDGRVLVTGGQIATSHYNRTGEVYDPTAQTTTALPMAAARAYHTATLLDAAGTVLILGGMPGSTPEYWKP
jgi:N-acetylneuraminic acid mutarotase